MRVCACVRVCVCVWPPTIGVLIIYEISFDIIIYVSSVVLRYRFTIIIGH